MYTPRAHTHIYSQVVYSVVVFVSFLKKSVNVVDVVTIHPLKLLCWEPHGNEPLCDICVGMAVVVVEVARVKECISLL